MERTLPARRAGTPDLEAGPDGFVREVAGRLLRAVDEELVARALAGRMVEASNPAGVNQWTRGTAALPKPPRMRPQLENATEGQAADRDKERAAAMEKVYGVKFSSGHANPLGVKEAKKAGVPGAGLPAAVYDTTIPEDTDAVPAVEQAHAKWKAEGTEHVTFNAAAFHTGLPFRRVMGAVKVLHGQGRVSFGVNRIGDPVSFRVKPAAAPQAVDALYVSRCAVHADRGVRDAAVCAKAAIAAGLTAVEAVRMGGRHVRGDAEGRVWVAGDVRAAQASHPFYGNQWTEHEGHQVVPLSRKATLGSEVVWKDDQGKVHHGQLGFRQHTDDDVKDVELRGETYQEHERRTRTGNVWVDPVDVVKYQHTTKSGVTVRELKPSGPKVLVPEERLAQMAGHGYRQREVNGSESQWLQVQEPDLARQLMDRKVQAGDGGRLFQPDGAKLEAFAAALGCVQAADKSGVRRSNPNEAHAVDAALVLAQLQSVANWVRAQAHAALAELQGRLVALVRRQGPGEAPGTLPALFQAAQEAIASDFGALGRQVQRHCEGVAEAVAGRTKEALARHHGRAAGEPDLSGLPGLAVLGATLEEHFGKMASDTLFRFKALVRQAVRQGCTTEEVVARLKGTDGRPAEAGGLHSEDVVEAEDAGHPFHGNQRTDPNLSAADASEVSRCAVHAAEPTPEQVAETGYAEWKARQAAAKKLQVYLSFMDTAENSVNKVIQAAIAAFGNEGGGAAGGAAEDEEGTMGWYWLAVHEADGSLSDRVCDECAFYDGNRWDADMEPVGDAPEYPGDPPVHFNCRCSLVPSDLDEPAPDMSFRDYLASFTRSEQERAFGKFNLAAYRRHEITAGQLVGQRDNLMSLEEFRKARLAGEGGDEEESGEDTEARAARGVGMVEAAGTSEGAKKGWEARRGFTVSGGTAGHQQEVKRILRQMPQEYTDGIAVKVGKTLTGGEAEHLQGSGVLNVDENVLNRKMFANQREGMDYFTKHQKENVQISKSYANTYDLPESGEVGDAYRSHLVAHEVGHHVWDKLDSNKRQKVAALLGGVNTPTTFAYQESFAEREAAGRAAGLVGRNTAESKLTRERFAEAFRQHVMEGKHGKIFKDMPKYLEARRKAVGAGRVREDSVVHAQSAARDFGCLMLAVPEDAAAKLVEFAKGKVPAAALAEGGVETEPHVTLLFGFDSGFDPSRLDGVLAACGPLVLKLGPVSRFQCGGHDVLKCDVAGEYLEDLHANLAQDFAADVAPSEYGYYPHLTLAYVQPGACPELDWADAGVARFEADTALYSLPDGKGRRAYRLENASVMASGTAGHKFYGNQYVIGLVSEEGDVKSKVIAPESVGEDQGELDHTKHFGVTWHDARWKYSNFSAPFKMTHPTVRGVYPVPDKGDVHWTGEPSKLQKEAVEEHLEWKFGYRVARHRGYGGNPLREEVAARGSFVEEEHPRDGAGRFEDSGRETVEQAAIRFRDGETFTGNSHMEAAAKIPDHVWRKYQEADWRGEHVLDEGFTTSRRPFVSREEAAKLAGRKGKLQSEQVVHSGRLYTSRGAVEAAFAPDQPRDAGGRWTAAGAFAAKHGLVPVERVGEGKAAKWRLLGGGDLPEHARGVVPPAYTQAHVSLDKDADVQGVGVDSQGRTKRFYSRAFEDRMAAEKWARLEELRKEKDDIARQNEVNLSSADPKVRENAACVKLVQATGLRPGSDGDTRAKVKAYGATTLEGRHVVADAQGNVRLKFVGKEGKSLDIPVEDAAVARTLMDRKVKAGDAGRLFQTDDAALRDYTRTMLDKGGFTPKDFRTLKGTEEAAAAVRADPKPSGTFKEYKRRVVAVAKRVAEKLGNTPTVALQRYIHPSVFEQWKPA
jgi:DNA topoisomerase-1